MSTLRTLLAASVGISLLSACTSLTIDDPDPSKAPRVSAVAPSAAFESSTSPSAAASSAADTSTQYAALEAFVASQETQLARTRIQLQGTYSEVTIKAERPDTVHYSYTLAAAIEPVTAENALAEVRENLTRAAQDALFPAMQAAGVTPTQQVRYTYLNPDGSEVYSFAIAAA